MNLIITADKPSTLRHSQPNVQGGPISSPAMVEDKPEESAAKPDSDDDSSVYSEVEEFVSYAHPRSN